MIEISNLTKTYGEQKAVDNISFKVEKGEILGFLGPNGAGKTTTMKIITCYMPPNAGDVTVGGFSVLDDSIEVRKMIGYLPEINPLYSDMNVVDFLKYIADLRGLSEDLQIRRIREMIDVCCLDEVLHKNINELSKGYRQRVGLAQAMIHDPEILILDEPTIGLDPNQVIDIRNLIKQLGREKTVVLSTHILSEVQATCDRAVIINNGRIVADSSLADLQRDLEGKTSINLEITGAENGVEERLSKIAGVDEVREVFLENSGGRSFRITSSPGSDPREEIFRCAVEAGWVIMGMSREIRSLEDVFHQLTRESINPPPS
ncbi:MAG TPA: ATP-binding cassette domain-containing protein [Bacteroidetes bacterium]|nr:ATP-binding cassette domain-containing protein [Bacteroidota bacterium]